MNYAGFNTSNGSFDIKAFNDIAMADFFQCDMVVDKNMNIIKSNPEVGNFLPEWVKRDLKKALQ